jgi:hypothetical protein
VVIDITFNFRKRKISSYKENIWYRICFILLSDINEGGKAKVTALHAQESKQKRKCILETRTSFCWSLASISEIQIIMTRLYSL